MAKFDPKKDKELWSDQHSGGLALSVKAYDGGLPKFQIGPRFFKNADGEVMARKAGRLSVAEAVWLLSKNNEIVDALSTQPTK